MVLRLLLLAFGIVEALLPKRTVDFWMGVAAADDQEIELRPWVYTVARIEGIVIVSWVLSKWLRGTGEADESAR